MKIIIQDGKLIDATELKEVCKTLANGVYEIDFAAIPKKKKERESIPESYNANEVAAHVFQADAE